MKQEQQADARDRIFVAVRRIQEQYDRKPSEIVEILQDAIVEFRPTGDCVKADISPIPDARTHQKLPWCPRCQSHIARQVGDKVHCVYCEGVVKWRLSSGLQAAEPSPTASEPERCDCSKRQVTCDDGVDFREAGHISSCPHFPRPNGEAVRSEGIPTRFVDGYGTDGKPLPEGLHYHIGNEKCDECSTTEEGKPELSLLVIETNGGGQRKRVPVESAHNPTYCQFRYLIILLLHCVADWRIL